MQLKRAWRNEAFAPELLPFEADLLDEMRGALERQVRAAHRTAHDEDEMEQRCRETLCKCIEAMG